MLLLYFGQKSPGEDYICLYPSVQKSGPTIKFRPFYRVEIMKQLYPS